MAAWIKKHHNLPEFVAAFTEIQEFGHLTTSIYDQTNMFYGRTLSIFSNSLNHMASLVVGPAVTAKLIGERRALKEYKPSGHEGMSVKFK